jgi:hypothetical protein
LVGCGIGSSEPQPTVTVTTMVTVTAQPPDSDSTAGAGAFLAEEVSPTGESGALDPATTGDGELTLTDAARAEPEGDWRSDRFNIAEENDIRGNAIDLDCLWDEAELEFRLENKFSELTFSAGQANSSESSDNVVKIEVLGDGEQMDVKNVPFNTIDSFSVDVTGVNALKINAVIDAENSACVGDSTPVFFDMHLS